MAADFVQVAPDSTGAKIQTFANTIGSDDVETQAVVLVDSSGAEVVTNAQRTAAASVVSTNGNVSAGKQSVEFIPSDDFSGTLLGVAWPNDNAAVGFSVTGPETLAAIAYTVTAGSLTILTVT